MKKLLFTLITLTGLYATALEVGDQAPCVILDHVQPTGEIKEHCIRDAEEKQTHTIIEFFSITCSACQANLPKINELAHSVTEKATTRLVAIDRDTNAVLKYITKHREQLPFEVALDNERFARKAYKVALTPTLFVLDKQFNVVYKHEGVLSPQDISHIQSIITGN